MAGLFCKKPTFICGHAVIGAFLFFRNMFSAACFQEYGMSRLAQFQNRINQQIPLTKSMGLQLLEWDGTALLLSAPLAPNSNHQGTGFGGSLYGVGVTAAWSVAELALADLQLEGTVVIQTGTIEYMSPVDGDFYSVCRLPDGEMPDHFRKSLARHGRARLELTAEIFCGDPSLEPPQEPAAVFRGRFVVSDVRSRAG
jgi:thioesterase domain-containing protein